jgi:hypothetical protein
MRRLRNQESMMIRPILAAAAVAALFALAVPAPAQARLANPGLNEAAPAVDQDTHYRPYRHWHRRSSYRRHRYRHCWNERIRVRVPGGYFVWRTHRRCGWRYRYW